MQKRDDHLDLSILILSYNTKRLLEECLQSVSRPVDGIRTEIVVVDNASSDGSAQLVEDDFPRVRLIKNYKNTFYSKGNNQAINQSQGKYILILNSDTVVKNNAFAKMIDFMEREPKVGALTCRMKFPNGRINNTCAKFTTFRNALCQYTFLRWFIPNKFQRLPALRRYAHWNPDSYNEVDMIEGSCLLVLRNVLNNLSGFDEQLTLYFSDEDLCRRIKILGWKVCYLPVGEIVHYERQSSRKMSREYIGKLFYRDLFTYIKKYYGGFRAYLLLALIRITIFIGVAKRKMILKNRLLLWL